MGRCALVLGIRCKPPLPTISLSGLEGFGACGVSCRVFGPRGAVRKPTRRPKGCGSLFCGRVVSCCPCVLDTCSNDFAVPISGSFAGHQGILGVCTRILAVLLRLTGHNLEDVVYGDLQYSYRDGFPLLILESVTMELRNTTLQNSTNEVFLRTEKRVFHLVSLFRTKETCAHLQPEP